MNGINLLSVIILTVDEKGIEAIFLVVLSALRFRQCFDMTGTAFVP